ncbi:uncharacterized protein LOC144361756 [Saccoglossus kowalevskii]
MKKLSSFHHNCLRRICKVFWPCRISSLDLLKRTGATCIIAQIRLRRLRWLGHVLRMPDSYNTKIALRWTPQGKRPRGRAKNTWRRTVEQELREMGLTWGEAETKAKNRVKWRDLVLTLCSGGSNKN